MRKYYKKVSVAIGHVDQLGVYMLPIRLLPNEKEQNKKSKEVIKGSYEANAVSVDKVIISPASWYPWKELLSGILVVFPFSFFFFSTS